MKSKSARFSAEKYKEKAEESKDTHYNMLSEGYESLYNEFEENELFAQRGESKEYIDPEFKNLVNRELFDLKEIVTTLTNC